MKKNKSFAGTGEDLEIAVREIYAIIYIPLQNEEFHVVARRTDAIHHLQCPNPA